MEEEQKKMHVFKSAYLVWALNHMEPSSTAGHDEQDDLLKFCGPTKEPVLATPNAGKKKKKEKKSEEMSKKRRKKLNGLEGKHN